MSHNPDDIKALSSPGHCLCTNIASDNPDCPIHGKPVAADNAGDQREAVLEEAARVADIVQHHAKTQGLPWRGGQTIADGIRSLKKVAAGSMPPLFSAPPFTGISASFLVGYSATARSTDIDALIERLTNAADCPESEKLYPKELLEIAAALAKLQAERDITRKALRDACDDDELVKAQAEIAKLQEEREEWAKAGTRWSEKMGEAQAEIATLRERVKELEVEAHLGPRREQSFRRQMDKELTLRMALQRDLAAAQERVKELNNYIAATAQQDSDATAKRLAAAQERVKTLENLRPEIGLAECVVQLNTAQEQRDAYREALEKIVARYDKKHDNQWFNREWDMYQIARAALNEGGKG